MRPAILPPLIVAVVLLLSVVPAAAQPATTGLLAVTIVDEVNGMPASGLVCAQGPRELCATPGTDGRATFVNVPPGDYLIQVSGYGTQGGGAATVRVGEIADVRVSTSFLPAERLQAQLSSNIRRTLNGQLASPIAEVRALLVNDQESPVDHAVLHLTGPAAATIRDCYVSGPGDDPCRRNQDNAEAQWFVGSVPARGQRGPFVAEYQVGTVGAAGIIGFSWYAWGQAGRTEAYSVTLGIDAAPPGVARAGAAALTVIPTRDGQAMPNAQVVAIGSPQGDGFLGVTDARGQVTFSNVLAGNYFLQVVDDNVYGAAQVMLNAGLRTQARLGVISAPGISSPYADGPTVVGGLDRRILVRAVTVNRFDLATGRPAGEESTTLVQAVNTATSAGEGTVTQLTITVTGPAATAYRSCSPQPCQRVTAPEQAAVQWNLGRLEPYTPSAELRAVYVSGTASAGNLGPNTVTASWVEGNTRRSYTVDLGQGVPRN